LNGSQGKPDGASRSIAGTLACSVEKSCGRDFSTYRVTAILGGSPASEAGLVKGDLLISVDGKRADALGLLEIYRQFEQEGRELSLEIKRKDSF
jgi:C-terminal processing protease CtpA/Prc